MGGDTMPSSRENTAFTKGYMQAIAELAAVYDAIHKCTIGQERHVHLTLISGVEVDIQRPLIVAAQPGDVIKPAG